MKVSNVLQRLDFRYHEWKCRNLVFSDFSRVVRKNRVNLYYWRGGHGDNVGDLLSLVLVRRIVESLGLDFDQPVAQTRRLYAIGSILEMAIDGVTVWGSGLHHTVLRPQGVRLDIRAVRGPLTRDALLKSGYECPEVFGDPAILLPLFYQPVVQPRRPFLVIPHFSKEKDLLEKYPRHSLSTLTSDWKSFVDAIASSERVISGSLHGVVLAEAYGVPATLLTSAMDRDGFKYEDYYRGTGRTSFESASTVDEALQTAPQVPPSFEACRARLLEAFPRDLWEARA